MAGRSLIPAERIERTILRLRGQNVMLDSDLATLYGVTRVLNQAVRRNRERFPPDFMLRLTAPEGRFLRSQIVILKTGRGRHRKYSPCAFAEQGIAMLSSVLRSKCAMVLQEAKTCSNSSSIFGCLWLRVTLACRFCHSRL